MKSFLWWIEKSVWALRCKYNYYLHGPYGLVKTLEKIPFRYIVSLLRKYGATVGEGCVFERGINLHRPIEAPPFRNLVIGNNVYIGHKVLIDLTRKVTIKDSVAIGASVQIWTHASHYTTLENSNPKYGEDNEEVVINKYSIIFANVVIMHGVNIGAFSRIGANSFVNRNIKPNSFVGGVPSKLIAINNSNN